MFGINGAELGVLLLVALIVVGPERLPGYAEQLGGLVRTLRSFLRTARERVTEELGEDVADVDWASLDPRRYDPRRIVREALLEEPARGAPAVEVTGRRYTTGGARRAAAAAAATGATAVPGGTAATDQAAGPGGATLPDPAPYDDEAT